MILLKFIQGADPNVGRSARKSRAAGRTPSPSIKVMPCELHTSEFTPTTYILGKVYRGDTVVIGTRYAIPSGHEVGCWDLMRGAFNLSYSAARTNV